jgi:hypothetical protein
MVILNGKPHSAADHNSGKEDEAFLSWFVVPEQDQTEDGDPIRLHADPVSYCPNGRQEEISPMSDDFELKIEITGEKSVVEAIAGAIGRDATDEARVSETRPARDEAKQAFGVAELTTVVLVLKGAYYLGKLADYIVEKLKQPKTKIAILTPFGTVEVTSKDELSPSEVRALLKKAADL